MRPTSSCRAIAFALAIAIAGTCAAETVTLQQGVGGYDGCVTATLWGPTSKATGAEKADQAVLAMRGSQNRLLVRFNLPEPLGAKKLARARLLVFVPKAENLRMICEILCREVLEGWSPGAAMDTTTDYHRGRPAGAADSYSLWEYDGQYFPHRYRFLGVPEGGKWIDFNVTPLVRKWLARPDTNHGVALEPIGQADRRFPNRTVIDVPAAGSPDAEHRPRLVLDFEPCDPPYEVGATHTLRKFCDRDTRYRFPGPFEGRYEMAMARNEFEPFQVLVYPMAGDLKGVRLEWTDLVDAATGAKIPQADVAYAVPEVFRMHPNGKTKDWYFHGKAFEIPDPLAPARPVDLPAHMAAPFWVTVRTRPDTKAGTYRGRVTVRPEGAPPRSIDLTVTVWDYAIPRKWNFQTMGQTCWDFIRQVHGRITPDLKRRTIDFLLDHRFNPTEQYADKLSPDLEDIPYVFERGGNTIYLSGNFTGHIDSLKQRYEAVRKLGLIDYAHVYIGDETKDWAEARRRSDQVRRACPELMIMIGGSFPRKELDGIIDIYDPQVDRQTNDVYSLPAERMRPLIAASQAKGEKFFWYVAAGPMLPCPNVQMEEPLIAARALFWMTWKFGVTGFEYYCYNIWRHNLPDKDGRRWPDKPFYPRGWGDTNGDGMLFYPGTDGPISSVRFENMRDGIEDWESHQVLADYAAALRAAMAKDAALRARAEPLLARAQAVLQMPQAVCGEDFTQWTWEPQVLLDARREMGETIEALAKLVPAPQMQAVAQARRQAVLQRQHAMLKARSQAARQTPPPAKN
ncbi:MAG TPA: glycoside hydrolase domain-containing protein [Phycisphaerae bacterium]|nr:glycoside hydrolase domain-containing protein [Phycisphaerae bacterium]